MAENKTTERKAPVKAAPKKPAAGKAEAKKPDAAQKTNGAKTEGLVYKNHPLRRVGNLIYFGSMADPYIILLQVKETQKEKDLDVATKVAIELQRTAPDLKSRDRVVRRSEKENLYDAMDISAIWLERALAGKL